MEAHDYDLGPIDIAVIGYPAGSPLTGDAAPLLMDLIDRGIIRVLDVMFVAKDDEGNVAGFEAKELDDKGVGDFQVFEGASSGLLGDDDVNEAASGLQPGEAAFIIVYENRWAAAFVSAVRRNGGMLLGIQRIPAAQVVEALDQLEAAEAAV